MTTRQDRFIKELQTSPTPTEAARRAGYKASRAHKTSYELMNKPHIRKKVERLAEKGLDALERQIDEGKVEVATVNAAKTLIETGFGKPRSNDEKHTPLPPINLIFTNTND